MQLDIDAICKGALVGFALAIAMFAALVAVALWRGVIPV